MSLIRIMASASRSLSIQAKLIALLVTVLGLSVFTLSQAGGALMVADKSSYIYDHSLARLEAVSAALESQMDRIRSIAEAAGRALALPLSPEEAVKVSTGFSAQLTKLGVRGLWILRPDGPAKFQLPIVLGDPGPGMEELLARLGWTPEAFSRNPLLVGSSSALGLPVGGGFEAGKSTTPGFFAVVDLPTAALKSDERALSVYIVDQHGRIVADRPGAEDSPPASKVEEWAASLTQETLASGVVDLNADGRHYIASYRRALRDQAIVIAALPRNLAFLGANELAKRSLALGVSISLLAIGLALLLARPALRRIRQLGIATRNVAKGDFTVQVDAQSRLPDELTSLAVSFNAMSDRISELLQETADKARMEKELEMAREVQKRFLPSSAVQTVPFRLAGKWRSASECAGDWWQFARLGELLVILVGDVTGHGVSAALITAAIHNAFHSAIRRILRGAAGTFSVQAIVEELNSAVWAAAGGSSLVTLNLSVVELRHGRIHWVSAGHPSPYLLRPAKAGGAAEVQPLQATTPTAPLGLAAEITSGTTSLQLAAGDMIVWYTDGLFEGHSSDEKRYPKRKFLADLEGHRAKNPAYPEDIATSILGSALQPLGTEVPEDDITVIVGIVPPDTQFPASTI